MPSPAREFAPVHFTSTALPERERIPFWRDMLARKLLSVELEPRRDIPFHAEVTLRALPGVRLVWCRAVSPVRCRRTPEIVAEGDDSFALLLNSAPGQMQVQSPCGQVATVGYGEAVSVLFGEPAALSLSHADWFGLILPRAALASFVNNVEDFTLRAIPRDSAALRLIDRYVGMLRDEALDLRAPELGHLVATHLRDLVATALGPTRGGAAMARERGLRAARLAAIKADVLESLDSGTPRIGSVAARQGITPRYVQMLFEAEGSTFSRFVLDQRLLRAHRLLRDRRYRDWTISNVAYDTGFGDLSYFNRSFRRRFGATPSDVRAKNLESPAA